MIVVTENKNENILFSIPFVNSQPFFISTTNHACNAREHQ